MRHNTNTELLTYRYDSQRLVDTCDAAHADSNHINSLKSQQQLTYSSIIEVLAIRHIYAARFQCLFSYNVSELLHAFGHFRVLPLLHVSNRFVKVPSQLPIPAQSRPQSMKTATKSR